MNKKVKTYKYKKNKGGSVIGRGSFGCAFRPALACKGSTRDGAVRNPYYDNKISKLMTNKEAKIEHDQLKKVYSIIKSIPNNENYFIPNSVIGFEMCELPVNETRRDTDYTDDIGDLSGLLKCKDLLNVDLRDTEEGVKKFLNSNRKNFKLIQQEDGGISLHKYIKDIDILGINKKELLLELNRKLCDLMKNGILEMNKRGLFHLDIKGDNIVIKNDKLKLIDWGVSQIIKNDSQIELLKCPTLTSHKIFSSILFDNDFINEINKGLKTFTSNNELNELVLKDIIGIEMRKSSHSRVTNIINIINRVYPEDDPTFLNYLRREQNIEDVSGIDYGLERKHFATNIIINFLYSIIDKYKKKNIFNIEKYYNEVYKFNGDIYSVLIIYIILVHKTGIITDNNIIDDFNSLFKKYLFEPSAAITKIDIDKLIEELTNIFLENTGCSSIRERERELEGIPQGACRIASEALSRLISRNRERIEEGEVEEEEIEEERIDIPHDIKIIDYPKTIENLHVILGIIDEDEYIKENFDKLNKKRDIILKRIIEKIRTPEELIDIYMYCLIIALNERKDKLISLNDALLICCIIINIVKNDKYGYKINPKELLVKKYNLNCKKGLFSKILGASKKTKKNRKRLKNKKTKNKKTKNKK